MANESPRTIPEIPTSLLESGKQGRLADAAGGNWLFAGRLVDHHRGFCVRCCALLRCLFNPTRQAGCSSAEASAEFSDQAGCMHGKSRSQ